MPFPLLLAPFIAAATSTSTTVGATFGGFAVGATGTWWWTRSKTVAPKPTRSLVMEPPPEQVQAKINQAGIDAVNTYRRIGRVLDQQQDVENTSSAAVQAIEKVGATLTPLADVIIRLENSITVPTDTVLDVLRQCLADINSIKQARDADKEERARIQSEFGEQTQRLKIIQNQMPTLTTPQEREEAHRLGIELQQLQDIVSEHQAAISARDSHIAELDKTIDELSDTCEQLMNSTDETTKQPGKNVMPTRGHSMFAQ